MLIIEPHRQSEAYCGPASLKMVLSYYGLEKSELALARLAGTRRRHGTPAAGLVKAAKTLGFDASIEDEAEIKDIRAYLRKKVPVIVNWFSNDEGHYSVVIGMDRKYIRLMDPEIGGLRTISLKDFNRIWFDFPGDYLRRKEDIVIRRMVVVKPKKGD